VFRVQRAAEHGTQQRTQLRPSTSLRATKGNDDSLDPQEEKVLDWILKAIVIFVLGWLALGVLMAVGGLFGIWK